MTSEYYQANREKIIARVRAYKAANREKVHEWARTYRERHAAQIAAYKKATTHLQKIRSRRRYEKKKDEVLKQSRDWYLKNRERALATRETYRKANRDAIRIQQRIRTRERRKTDPVFHFVVCARRRMLNALEGVGAKSARTLELLGCTGAEAVAHLEKQFKPGMSWANRREWHVDHVKALARFDLTKPEQQRQAFHYTNLQPLWASENRHKGAH